jgi:hypothetical protein
MSRYLLREFHILEHNDSLLTEEDRRRVDDGASILVGIMQTADKENGNGRVYSREVLKRETKNYMKLISERRAVGELDHPEDSVVNLKNVSHVVTDLWWNNNNLMGKIEVLDTPSGQILKSLIESNIKIGISSRGLGSTEKRGHQTIVKDDFQLICFDIVSEPSTPNAFMSRMNERKEREIFTKADRINRSYNDLLE